MRSLSEEKEAQLINRSLYGDSEAMNQLIGRYYKKIIVQIQSQVNDAAIANDLAQEVCIKLFRYLGDFDFRSNFSTWLHCIIQNTLKNYYRANSKELLMFVQNLPATPLYNTIPGPEMSAIELQLGDHLDKIMGQLPEKMSHCFILHILNGLSYEDIAAYMGCPLGTVRSRIHRTRDILKAGMEDNK
ncbi:RNA polymerase sigma factor [Legionella spiritensis]|uniref:Sigma factor RpoE (Sigma 24) n=1 Tax=Legionella spiritensis TaxID=452 RepID=A0A0W0Z478_LEGSP|nr:sigma-70 family RNA polymerase sigma factor [Legionella spiritensis]KTD63946.1 Sigma factor RpoE (sigma 24) [Legionella spiritensis]SNV36747.1 Sigma factor RpoE (sigma 24) [Legionella spiritensis]VEG89981.1 Sigma factor RpoE (sigma 24) [Legionella spiritensis]